MARLWVRELPPGRPPQPACDAFDIGEQVRMDESETGSSLADKLAGLHLYHQLTVLTDVVAVHSFCLFFRHVNLSDRLQQQLT